jgi:head-tail adaptor
MPPTTRGDRRHLITLRNPGDPIPDGHGGFAYTWNDLTPSTMFAAVRPTPVRNLERDRADTNLTTATHTITMDFHPQVTTQTRVWVDGGGVFNVTGIRNPDLQAIDHELTCEEVIA